MKIIVFVYNTIAQTPIIISVVHIKRNAVKIKQNNITTRARTRHCFESKPFY